MRVNFHAHWSDRLVNVHPSYTGWGWRLKLSAGPRSEHSNAKRSNVARAPPRHYGRIHPFNSGAALFVWWHLHISIRWWGIKRKAIAFPPLKHMVRGTARTETQFAVMLKALSALPPPCPAMQNGGGGGLRRRTTIKRWRCVWHWWRTRRTSARHGGYQRAVHHVRLPSKPLGGGGGGGSHLIRCPDWYMLISSVRGGKKKMMICHDSRHSLRHWHASVLVASQSWIISFVIKDDVAGGLWK